MIFRNIVSRQVIGIHQYLLVPKYKTLPVLSPSPPGVQPSSEFESSSLREACTRVTETPFRSEPPAGNYVWARLNAEVFHYVYG